MSKYLSKTTMLIVGGLLAVSLLIFAINFWEQEKPTVETIPPESVSATPPVTEPRVTEESGVVEKPKPATTDTVVPGQPFIEGGHYERLSETQPVQTGDKIEVVELFWYQCPHCYRLEPFITQWRHNKPENAEFVPVPAIFNERWAFDARMYYTLEALDLDRQLHADLFAAIHETRRPLTTAEQFADWAVENGADRQALNAALDSFAVETRVNFATVMSRKYGITGVPAIIVDGKYRTSVSLAGSHEKLIEVINYLVTLAAEQRG